MNTLAIVKPLTQKITKKSFIIKNTQGEYFDECFTQYLDENKSDNTPTFYSKIFSPEYWKAKHAISGVAQGRGATYFIQPNSNNHWVLRHYYRGGLIGKLNRDSYIFTGIEKTRAYREFHLLYQLHEKGLPVPMPVAYRVIKKGICYHADLLSQRIENAQDLVGMLTKQAITSDLWHKIGAVIKTFHDNNVYHHDLNAHNILIDDQEKIWIIDFDQGEIREKTQTWKNTNLARLERSFIKEKNKLAVFCWEDKNWQQLLKGYQL